VLGHQQEIPRLLSAAYKLQQSIEAKKASDIEDQKLKLTFLFFLKLTFLFFFSSDDKQIKQAGKSTLAN
jgi:hypothetical protein